MKNIVAILTVIFSILLHTTMVSAQSFDTVISQDGVIDGFLLLSLGLVAIVLFIVYFVYRSSKTDEEICVSSLFDKKEELDDTKGISDEELDNYLAVLMKNSPTFDFSDTSILQEPTPDEVTDEEQSSIEEEDVIPAQQPEPELIEIAEKEPLHTIQDVTPEEPEATPAPEDVESSIAIKKKNPRRQKRPNPIAR